MEPPEEIVELRAKQDTIIQGKTCRWLELTQKPFHLHTLPGIAVYEEGSRVYFVEDTSFYLLYDFALNEGDTYTSRLTVAFDSCNQSFNVQEETALIRIDSVKMVMVDGQMRKLQVTSTDILGFGGRMLEGIGCLNSWLFPRVGYGPAEYSEFFGIICYKNGEIGYGDTTSCLISSVKKAEEHDMPALFPNPSDGRFFWQIATEKLISIAVYDAAGVLVAYYSTMPQMFDLSMMPKGNYFVKATYADGKSLSAKIALH